MRGLQSTDVREGGDRNVTLVFNKYMVYFFVNLY